MEKAVFVKSFGELLKVAGENVKSLEYENMGGAEAVIINYDCGYRHVVNVTGDSLLCIIKDVIERV